MKFFPDEKFKLYDLNVLAVTVETVMWRKKLQAPSLKPQAASRRGEGFVWGAAPQRCIAWCLKLAAYCLLSLLLWHYKKLHAP